MSREKRIWGILFVLAGLFLLYRATLTRDGMGKVYLKPVAAAAADAPPSYVRARPNDPQAALSLPRTLGIWFAAFLTLSIFSFLYKDNPFYRFAEAVMVGVSAAYLMVAGFWDGIVPKLLGRLAPAQMSWASPSLENQSPDWWGLVPLVMSAMLLARLLPKGGWIARWPLAFIVGTYAGIRLISFLDADFVSQIRNTIVPLVVMNQTGQLDLWGSVRNVLMIMGVLSSLAYFYFSLDHKGAYGVVARVGVWYLMITFGASFAFTVMGRIALFASRLEFLFDDWLWLIDPLGKRSDLL
ncbi:MAG: hypothetical protein NT069_08640 [Planctomycetota bacterium]|nr:hypothetical protein [Planctomycetota bacterium]